MDDQGLLDKVRQHVLSYYDEHTIQGICFHDLNHTALVIKALNKLSAEAKLFKKELVVLEIAAWFQNTGYLQRSEDFLKNSAALSAAFLEENHAPEATINLVRDLILVTRKNHRPTDPLEKIMYDANFYYLSKKGFRVKTELLRKETEFIEQKAISADTWHMEMIWLMEGQKYYSPFGISKLSRKKEDNLAELKKELAGNEKGAPDQVFQSTKQHRHEGPGVDAAGEKNIDTLFKIATSNNQRSFTLGDNKAHILITVNSIITSLLVSLVLRKLDANQFLVWPTFIFLISSSTSTVFAILATRPKINLERCTAASLEHKESNLIYFGTFKQLKLDEYIKEMEGIITDRGYIYHTLIRDIYWHGMVLVRKYAFLHKAYNAFLFGLVVSIAAFIIAYLLHQQAGPAKIH